ncbi:MFS transporter [Variovorax paradoxus]|nr:MFS transporter [Variovorax paradoxus]
MAESEMSMVTPRSVAWLRNAFDASPLRKSTFRLFYFGSVGTALGYTMQATVASWLMATLTPSAFMVALVQTASTLPTLLFGLIAGSLADLVERRKVILVTQFAMLGTVVLLGASVLAGLIGPVVLLVLTFLIGCGFTFYLPAQQASVNELVSREELPEGVALTAVAFNSARAAGPALAGALAAWWGLGSTLLAAALFFSLMIIVVKRWKHREPELPGVPERLLTGARSGVRFAWHSSAMRALIARSLSFVIFASAFWALLPVIARDLLALGAQGFGLLSAGFGGGAIFGAWSVPRQLKRMSLNTVVLVGNVSWAVSIALLVATNVVVVAVAGAFIAGVAWVCVLASISAGVQSSAPAWVRARAVAMNLVATQASMAVGSALWGLLATQAGIRVSLIASAVGLLVTYALTRRLRAEFGTEADVMPHVLAPDLVIANEPQPDDGPVLIQIEYRVDRQHWMAFFRALEFVAPTRRRNGATSWRVFRDLEDHDRIVERYVVASWADYLRHRARMTMADSELQESARRFQREGVPIRVSRLLGLDAAAVSGDAAQPSAL